MRCKILFLLMGATLSIGVPSLGAQQAVPERTPVPGWRDELERKPVNTASPYTPWRWVGLRSKGTAQCPWVPDWELVPRPDEMDDDLSRDMGLDRYCVYEARKGSPRFPLPLPAGLESAQADRMALSITSTGGGASGPVGQGAAEILEEHFRQQTRGFTAPGTLEFKKAPSVRLVFLDSHEDGAWPLTRPTDSLHGYTLAHLSHTLVCPENGPCAAEIATHPALRYADFDPYSAMPPALRKNGDLGLVSDVGDAILVEVSRWRSQGKPGRLILNLSLGWDGELGDLKAKRASQLEPSVRYVYDALRYASRSGALVIASAGNRRGGPEETRSPLLPAAWEMKRPSWIPAFLGRKRIYAVGGNDWQGLHLPNSRPGGRPRRTAFADHAVTEGSDGDPTAIYTGTSVSAAVASSIAAVVWHLRPDLTPRQVMRIVTRSGELLPAKADAYSWQGFWPLSHLLKAPYIRRLSLCRAVERACGPGGAACPEELQSVSACEPFEKKGAADLSPLLAQSLPPVSVALPSAPVAMAPPCDSGALFWGVLTGADAPCPVERFPDRTGRRWVIPQPPNDPCPSCILVPDPPGGGANSCEGCTPIVVPTEDKEAYILIPEIGGGWNTSAITEPVLNLDCSGAPRNSFPLALADLLANKPLRIELGRTLDDCTASLDFKVKQGNTELSIQNPVYVDP